MHADLLEQPAVHHTHLAAAAGLAGMVCAPPLCAHETPRVGGIERGCRIVLQLLEALAEMFAQRFEPASRPRFAILDHGHVYGRHLIPWSVIGAAFVATVSVDAHPRDPSGMLYPIPDEARDIFQRRRAKRRAPVQELVVE